MDNVHPQRCHTVRTEDVIAAVKQSIEDNPNKYIFYGA